MESQAGSHPQQTVSVAVCPGQVARAFWCSRSHLTFSGFRRQAVQIGFIPLGAGQWEGLLLVFALSHDPFLPPTLPH